MTLGEKLYTLRNKTEYDTGTAGRKASGFPPVYFQMGIRCHTPGP